MRLGFIKRVCENPDCLKEFTTPFHRQVYCCEECRNAVRRTARLPVPEPPPPTVSKLDEMSPNDLLYYGKLQAQHTLEMMKRNEKKRGKEK